MIESWTVKKILRAFESRDFGSIESLALQQCIDPNALIPSKGVSLLHLIIGHQSESFALKVIKLFIRCGGDPNVQSSDGVTPVHVAVAWGRNRILHLLLVNGGDPWVQDEDKKNAFNYAFEERKWSTIELLHRFQQMHSAANFRQDIFPKYERSLERVLLRKGEEMFAYAPSRKSMKSMTTQTQTETRVSSPVQDKIKYFEPQADVEMSCPRESEKNIGWLKDFYQTPGEVVVHREASESPDEKKETFVSSIHIDTSPTNNSNGKKIERSSADVRGQLFVELQEAVRRRSKLKMSQEHKTATTPNQSVLIEKDSSKDHFLAKEVSYLYGINLEESGMLKNMSDFATKVMNEIEITEADRLSERTIDLCVSSPDLTGAYFSCEEEAGKRKSDGQNVDTCHVPQTNSVMSNLYLTPYSSGIAAEGEKKDNSNDSFLSVAEEYKYTDAEEGVVLLEKKLVVTPTISFDEEAESSGGENASSASSSSSLSSTASTVPSSLSYNSDVLRCELNGLGYHPGPITVTTKKLYLRKLWRLKKEAMRTAVPEKENPAPVLSPVLEKTLTKREFFDEIPTFSHLEEEMMRSFEGWTNRKWREGMNKTSFNYLLLDPRVSLNLPRRSSEMTTYETWRSFLSGIFYIGKGKRSRPYAHLYKAIAFWEKRSPDPPDEKTEKIIEIWKEGLGVVCLQVFQNIIPVEALTREAAMIDAMGGSSLKNVRGGEYYGAASTWSTKDKIRLGMYLLHKAMLIFLNEGERQIKPYDID